MSNDDTHNNDDGKRKDAATGNDIVKPANSNDKTSNMLTRRPNKEELMEKIRMVAERLGRAPRLKEFLTETGLNIPKILRHFGSYSKALRACGFESYGSERKATIEMLFAEWAAMVRDLGEPPTVTEYGVRSRYSRHPLVRRFGGWQKVAAGMLQYAKDAGLEEEWADVIEIVRKACAKQWNGNANGSANGNRGGSASGTPSGSSWGNSRCASSSVPKIRDDRPVYGPPLRMGCVGFAPNCEAAVMFLFATMAERLGFFMTYIGTKFPDAEAIREAMPGKWQLVRIEFEYESRNFVEHRHDPAKCDLIVCWEHNWEECPLEVLELKEVVGKIG